MKIIRLILFFAALSIPFSGDADTPIDMNSSAIKGWATGYQNLAYGSGVDNTWKTPQKALGKATGDTYDVVSLGNGGQITMTFSPPINNGSGPDFAVFENSISDSFLELAWVEVSSDGIHFVRFFNYSLSTNPVGTYGTVDPAKVSGLASKFIKGKGTQFDLQHLEDIYNNPNDPSLPHSAFTPSFRNQLTNNFPYLDLDNIRYVRIIDIIGDGNAFDAFGNKICDPHPTSGSGGFDLEAVAVMNQVSDNRLAQNITFSPILNQKFSTGSLTLNATASSGLPVSYTLLEGNATVSSNRLTFTGTGRIVVQAQQAGNVTYAPAVPVTQSFYVGQKIQHIYVEPIPNQITGTTWQVRATASSGLPVSIEILSGPTNALIHQTNHLLTASNLTGTIELRAWQSGNAEYAPADDVRVTFSIVASNATTAPKTFAQWSTNRNLAVNAQLDSDGDGVKNFQEYIMGTSPTNSADIPRFNLNAVINAYGEPAIQFNFRVNRQAYGRAVLQQTETLTGTWSNVVPQLVSSLSVTNSGQAAQELNVQVPVETSKNFYRLLFQEP
jgi:hypothetical protein